MAEWLNGWVAGWTACICQSLNIHCFCLKLLVGNPLNTIVKNPNFWYLDIPLYISFPWRSNLSSHSFIKTNSMCVWICLHMGHACVCGFVYIWVMHVYVGLCACESCMCMWVCIHMGHACLCGFVSNVVSWVLIDSLESNFYNRASLCSDTVLDAPFCAWGLAQHQVLINVD